VILYRCLPKSVEKMANDRLLVKWTGENGTEFSDQFDTILFAIGRRALTRELHLDKAGVTVAGDGEKIEAVDEQTNVPHIYAVGDVLYVRNFYVSDV
jgi:pyruvate/2-oxoglutarate dehydrogenase complex dihydrolipoamide dehydrogenase (E3) component